MPTTQWWYFLDDDNGPRNVGPFNSRETAAVAAFNAHPELKTVFTGYGLGGAFFDIMWPSNPSYEEKSL